MNWILIIVLIVLVLIIIKFKEVRHKAGFLIVLLILVFIVATGYNVYKANNVDVSTFEGVVKGGKVYFAWLGGAFTNFKSISGFAVKQKWDGNVTDKEITNRQKTQGK